LVIVVIVKYMVLIKTMMHYIWTFPGDITQTEEQQILSSTNSRKDEDIKLRGMHEETREPLEEF